MPANIFYNRQLFYQRNGIGKDRIAVANPGPYVHYRLDITENTGAPTVSLAQLELLAR